VPKAWVCQAVCCKPVSSDTPFCGGSLGIVLAEHIGAHLRANDKGTAHRYDGDRNANSQNDSPPNGQPAHALDKSAEVEEKGKFTAKMVIQDRISAAQARTAVSATAWKKFLWSNTCPRESLANRYNSGTAAKRVFELMSAARARRRKWSSV
jgi:hypothetical protein